MVNRSSLTFGADAIAEANKKQERKFSTAQVNHTTGYCGCCKTRYEGNHTQHQCN